MLAKDFQFFFPFFSPNPPGLRVSVVHRHFLWLLQSRSFHFVFGFQPQLLGSGFNWVPTFFILSPFFGFFHKLFDSPFCLTTPPHCSIGSCPGVLYFTPPPTFFLQPLINPLIVFSFGYILPAPPPIIKLWPVPLQSQKSLQLVSPPSFLFFFCSPYPGNRVHFFFFYKVCLLGSRVLYYPF